MPKMRTTVLVLLALTLVASIPAESPACWLCRYSPHGWGFCRSGYLWGHTDCSEKVVDPFNGTTDCEIYGWGQCSTSGGGPGDPFDPVAESRPCSWTDVETIRLV